MRRTSAVWCAVLLVAGCAAEAPEEAFEDKGLGVWVPAKGVPALSYRAVWGVNAREVYAVGEGGVAVGGEGVAWRQVDDVPAASYRAVRGR